ncbi:hypothetical protein [Companilactobacillus futsaii]|uniref:AbrB family transcriptional regulator n=1 Tax=Companilactobacillus futsaii JCM 17355 TaxID=1423818 RepID=A0ABR5P6N9_9LACO|nr:hypothetical protein [Companilactobacillus futsaii]KRK93404.1 hypothetical protein FC88_GL000325 [Companilactobacillus futsaii JCM 17355]
MSVKVKAINGEQVITIPSTIHPMATEYEMYQGYDGTIVCLPKNNDNKRSEAE